LLQSNKVIRHILQRLKNRYNASILLVFVGINSFLCDVKDEAEEIVNYLAIKVQHDQLFTLP